MKLYVMPGACSLASHIALIWAGAPYEVAVLSHDEVGGDAYRQVNPKGAVPALVLDDGTVITESVAVLEYKGPGHIHLKTRVGGSGRNYRTSRSRRWNPQAGWWGALGRWAEECFLLTSAHSSP